MREAEDTTAGKGAVEEGRGHCCVKEGFEGEVKTLLWKRVDERGGQRTEDTTLWIKGS